MDDFGGSLEYDGGVEGEETPSEFSRFVFTVDAFGVIFTTVDPCFGFFREYFGTFLYLFPFFVLDGYVEFGGVLVVIAFDGLSLFHGVPVAVVIAVAVAVAVAVNIAI